MRSASNLAHHAGGPSVAPSGTQPHHMRRVLTPLKGQPVRPVATGRCGSDGCEVPQPSLATVGASASFTVSHPSMLPAAATVASHTLISDNGPTKPNRGGRHGTSSNSSSPNASRVAPVNHPNHHGGSSRGPSREALKQECDALWHAMALLTRSVAPAQLEDIRNRVSLDLHKWDAMIAAQQQQGHDHADAAAGGGVRAGSLRGPGKTRTARRVSFSGDANATSHQVVEARLGCGGFRPVTADGGVHLPQATATTFEGGNADDSPSPVAPPASSSILLSDVVLEDFADHHHPAPRDNNDVDVTPSRGPDAQLRASAVGPVTPIPIDAQLAVAAPFRRRTL